MTDFLNAHFWPLWWMAIFLLVFWLAVLDRLVHVVDNWRRR